jgi:hypothetical protein
MVAGSGTSAFSGTGVVSNTGIIASSKETPEEETPEDVTGGSVLEAPLPPFLSPSSRHPINRRDTIKAIIESLIKFLISLYLL